MFLKRRNFQSREHFAFPYKAFRKKFIMAFLGLPRKSKKKKRMSIGLQARWEKIWYDS